MFTDPMQAVGLSTVMQYLIITSFIIALGKQATLSVCFNFIIYVEALMIPTLQTPFKDKMKLLVVYLTQNLANKDSININKVIIATSHLKYPKSLELFYQSISYSKKGLKPKTLVLSPFLALSLPNPQIFLSAARAQIDKKQQKKIDAVRGLTICV